MTREEAERLRETFSIHSSATALEICKLADALLEAMDEVDKVKKELDYESRVRCECYFEDDCITPKKAISGELLECDLHKRQREKHALALAVVEAARELQRSGYDGPFIGDVTVPLFEAINTFDEEVKK